MQQFMLLLTDFRDPHTSIFVQVNTLSLSLFNILSLLVNPPLLAYAVVVVIRGTPLS